MPIPRHSDVPLAELERTNDVPLAEARGDKRCFSRGDNKLVLQDEIEGKRQIWDLFLFEFHPSPLAYH